MNLQTLNLVELNAQEVQEVEGGFIPLLIYAGWGAMVLCSSITAGMYYGYHNN